MVVSTSITKGINTNIFRKNFNGNASFHRFHGAKVRHIKNYLPTHLAEEQPDLVIVQASGNDLSSGKIKKHSVLEIANHIVDMGHMCKRYGVKRVVVSSVLPREDFYFQLHRLELNNLLRDLCVINNFEFLENSMLALSHHVHSDGVHLNTVGSDILASNYLQCFYDIL